MNHLAAARCRQPLAVLTHSFGRRAATAQQASAIDHITGMVARCGPPPPDLSEQRALRELLAGKSLYGQVPASLARYSFDHLKVARGQVQPRHPRAHVPPAARAILAHFDTQIEMSTEQLATALKDKPLPVTKCFAALHGSDAV